jgi:RNA polymerase sigma-70 factor, ECF subfamily
VEPETDEVLLEGIRAGDAKSFARMYQRYRGPLYAFCFRLTAEMAKAEDAVHESFLKLASGAKNIRTPAALRTWLFRVARNEALAMLRSYRKTLPLSESEDEAPWETDTPLSLLESKNTAEIVEQAIRKLKTEYREVILLREFEELSYAEIAEITSATEGAVRARIFKARKALGEKLHLFMDGRQTP